MPSIITVRYLAPETHGAPEPVRVAAGATARDVVAMQSPGVNPGQFAYRVNRAVASGDHKLQDGDLLAATPMNLKGAA